MTSIHDSRPAIVRWVERWAEGPDPAGRLPGRVSHDAEDVATLTAAARRVLDVHPGIVGELLRREILAYRDFGYRFDGSGLVPRLARQILDEPEPG